MKTKIILFSFIFCGLVSCSNQADKIPAGEIQKESSPSTTSDSTNFTIVTTQDTTTKDGESISRYKSGAVRMQGMMKDSKREGLWKSFYENGVQWSESTFVCGVKFGKTTTWYENGNKRYEGFYANDKESGMWTFWNEAGELVNTKNFGKK
jgi:antitoxin component YwqK of YwqJK toxin-antitoxin module